MVLKHLRSYWQFLNLKQNHLREIHILSKLPHMLWQDSKGFEWCVIHFVPRSFRAYIVDDHIPMNLSPVMDQVHKEDSRKQELAHILTHRSIVKYSCYKSYRK